MRTLSIPILVAGLLCLGLDGLAQGKNSVLPVSIIDVIANPEKYEGQKVAVIGFLVIEREPRHPIRASLHVHEEDAKRYLGNSVSIIPSQQMLKDRGFEAINQSYVRLTGKVTISRAQNGGRGAFIRDIEECVPWPPAAFRK